jgi:hypothetical protein
MLSRLSISDAILVIIWVEALSIGFWSGVSARRAGFARRGIVLAVVAGVLVGGVVLLLQVVLQPGKASEGGVADGARPALTARACQGKIRA